MINTEIGNKNKSASLTAQQKSLWVLEQDSNTNGVYNLPLLYSFKGELDIERVHMALDYVLQSNDELRTIFKTEDGMPLQTISDVSEFPITEKDISGKSNKEVMKEIELEAAKPFNLNKDGNILVRGVLYTQSTDQNLLLILIHHTLADGTTLSLFSEKFEHSYNNIDHEVIENNVDYLDYAEQQKEEIDSGQLDYQLDFWKETLEGAPELIELPLDKKRSQNQRHRGDRVDFNVSSELFTDVNKFAKANRVTPYVIYLSAFSVLLSRYTRQDDIVMGTLVSNRNDADYEHLMGYFANTVLIRSQLNEDMTFGSLVKSQKEVVIDALSNAEYPINKIAEELKPTRDSSYNPLFQVLFVLQNFENADIHFEGLETTVSDVNTHTSKVDLNLTITPNVENAQAFLEYDSDLFERNSIERMAKNYQTLLTSLVNYPERNIYKADLLTEAEIKKEVAFAEKSQVEIPVNQSMVDVFNERVKATPNKTAIKYENETISYTELNDRSNRLANYLLSYGIQTETKVSVLLNRSIDMVVTILAILKSGAAYVPIDASYPQDRVNYILENSESPVVVTTSDLVESLNEAKIDKLILDEVADDIANSSVEDPDIQILPNNLAYIIYTSGSTGRPKGVLVEHHNVIRLLGSTGNVYDFKTTDVWTMFHSYAFDYSIWEIWGALLNGSTLVIVPYMVTRSPEEFYDLVVNEKVTILSQTPAAFRQFRKIDEASHSDLSVRYITSGGEALDINNLKDWFNDHSSNDIKIINMYGITETTVHSTSRVIKEEDAHSDDGSVIGVPLSDLAIYLLDSNHNIVPRGVTGEMYIAGQGVTRGYLNRPEMTKERFIENPFHESKYKVYKSGDLARININGELEYIGRADQQVKIRGFRVELGEIESVVNDSVQIENATISTVVQDGVNSLVGYIVPRNIDGFDLQILKDEMKLKLPDYMIPSFFVPLDKLPLTPNGKIDKRKLPEPSKDNVLTVSENVQPTNDVERELVDIWKEVLDIDEVGITDDFFDLGGHSLLAVKMTSIIKTRFGKNLPISVLFDDSTVRELAKRIESDSDEYLKNNLVQIKNVGDKTPVFIVHPGMGQVMCFNDLVRNMDEARPVYALRATGLYGERKPFNNVENMATHYISELKKAQQEGPYNIAGYCVGGSIAHEMVYQLRKNGDKVNSLSVMDIVPPLGYDHLNEEFIVSYFVEQFFKSFDVVDESIKENISVYTEEELKTKNYSHDQYIQYMLEIVKGLNIVDSDYTKQEMEYWYDTWKNTILAMDKHRAKVVDVPMNVYHAVDGDYSGDEWYGYSSVSVKRIDIAGDHYTMLKEPLVKRFAKDFSNSLREFD